MSGRAWNIPALARHLGVVITALCWPYVLCLAASDDARATRCDAYGKPNHGAHGQGKHISLDLSQLDNFWRSATEEEKQGLKSFTRAPGKGKGQPRGRGQLSSRGRGRAQSRRPAQGRGRGRGGHLDQDLEYDDEEFYEEELFDDYEGVYEDYEEGDDDQGVHFLALTQRGAGRQGDDQSPPLASSSSGAPTHRFVLLSKDLGSFRVGRADATAPIDSLPSPKAPASAATQHNVLHSPMRTLAAHVLNEGRLLIDEGGRGQCGPNTLAFQIGLLDSILHLGSPDGPTLRAACCKHILQRSVQLRVTSITDEYGMPMMLGPLVINTMLHWPHGATDLKTSVENWCALISKPETWTDIAFLQIVSDMCQVAIHVTGVGVRPQRNRPKYASPAALRPEATKGALARRILARSTFGCDRRLGKGERCGAGGSARRQPRRRTGGGDCALSQASWRRTPRPRSFQLLPSRAQASWRQTPRPNISRLQLLRAQASWRRTPRPCSSQPRSFSAS